MPYVIQETAEMGKGIFSLGLIRKGQRVFSLTRDNHVIFRNVAEINSYLVDKPPQERCRIMEVAYGEPALPGCVVYITDDGQFINHSNNPNTGPMEEPSRVSGGSDQEMQKEKDPPQFSSWAVRDINAGEELLENYSCYAFPSWFLDELEQHQLMPTYCMLRVQGA